MLDLTTGVYTVAVERDGKVIHSSDPLRFLLTGEHLVDYYVATRDSSHVVTLKERHNGHYITHKKETCRGKLG